jgi:hypothetical protein
MIVCHKQGGNNLLWVHDLRWFSWLKMSLCDFHDSRWVQIKGETADLDHSKLKINHVNSTESLKIIMNHLNSSRVTRTHDRSSEISKIMIYNWWFYWFLMIYHEFQWLWMSSNDLSWVLVIPDEFRWFMMILSDSVEFTWFILSFEWSKSRFPPWSELILNHENHMNSFWVTKIIVNHELTKGCFPLLVTQYHRGIVVFSFFLSIKMIILLILVCSYSHVMILNDISAKKNKCNFLISINITGWMVIEEEARDVNDL